ncbi:hypothetical protein, partial [Staphylococcus aureus]
GAAPPVVPPPVAPDFSAVRDEINRFTIPDVAVLIGDRDGVLFKHQRGSMAADRPVYIASASKLLLGLTAWLLVEDGVFTPQTPASSQ